MLDYIYIYICYVLRSLLHFHIFERTSLESSVELLFHVYYNTTLRYGNMTKYGKQKNLTRQKDVNKCAKCWKGCRRPPSGQTLSVFLTSISNEILQNHHFLVIHKITMNPKHLQTHGPLEAPAPCFCWNSIEHWCGQTCENSHLKWHFWAKTRSKLSPKGGCILPR